MTLSIISLGLWDENSMTFEAKNAAQDCDTLYAEFYTARLLGSTDERIAAQLGMKIEVLPREKVEKNKWLVEEAKEKKVGLLVAGDCMTATTHVDLKLDAEKAGVPVKLVFGTSIYTAAAGLSGLQIYKFGKSTSITFPEPNFKVKSHY
ncbi:MAG: diphthine synthase, partial [Candidatus Undinarchaeales archaeon]|nr:diphthine synthase [Candidatus Undinarchaeales archaeon]